MKPLTIVIFGSTGDLYQKKLARALFDLHRKDLLGKDVRIIGYGRRPYSNDDFRIRTQEALAASNKELPEQALNLFLKDVYYEKGEIEDPTHYDILKKALERHDSERGIVSNKIFYLAVSPKLYEIILRCLAASGLTQTSTQSWARVLVEKPFGSNLTHAIELDRLVGKLFKEDQIFRIDHYLAKHTMQDILAFRFSNSIFEPLWNNKYIEKIEVTFLEKHIVGDRGALYDDVGALRDVGQNHMLQMLALVAMEQPTAASAHAVQTARENFFKTLILPKKKGDNGFIRAQYDGYHQEKGVALDSQTETYFKVTLQSNHKRWKGVPLYLESGKALKDAQVSIKIYFKSSHQAKNVLTFSIQPREKISIQVWSKNPAFTNVLESRSLEFTEKADMSEHILPDAYERVFYDCIVGDHTLFTTTKEVISEWKIITEILKIFPTLPLHRYHKGAEAGDFIVVS